MMLVDLADSNREDVATVLVFLTGQDEIENVQRVLEDQTELMQKQQEGGTRLVVVPLI